MAADDGNISVGPIPLPQRPSARFVADSLLEGGRIRTLTPAGEGETVPTRAIWVFSRKPTEPLVFADDDRHTEGLNIYLITVWHWRGSDCDIAEAWHHGGEIVSAY